MSHVIAATLLAATLVALPTVAIAEVEPPSPAEAPPSEEPSLRERIATEVLHEATREETRDKRAFLYSIMAGFHSDIAATLDLRLGFGTGKVRERLLLPTTTLWRVSVAARGTYGREDSMAVSLLGGWSKVTSIGISLEAGVDGRLDPDDRAIGPIVAIGVRTGNWGLHLNGWYHVAGDTTGVDGFLAIGYSGGDYTSAADVAKARAVRRILEELRRRR